MNLCNVDKFQVKLTNGKSLKYGFGLEQFADNAHEKSLAMAELYGRSDFTQ